MNGRTCLITGATDGIGKETAIGMAKNGYNLILIGRNEEKGKKVSDEIRKIADSIDIDFFKADLMLMKEISRVADEVCQKYDQIDVLINNVGAYFCLQRCYGRRIRTNLCPEPPRIFPDDKETAESG